MSVTDPITCTALLEEADRIPTPDERIAELIATAAALADDLGDDVPLSEFITTSNNLAVIYREISVIEEEVAA